MLSSLGSTILASQKSLMCLISLLKSGTKVAAIHSSILPNASLMLFTKSFAFSDSAFSSFGRISGNFSIVSPTASISCLRASSKERAWISSNVLSIVAPCSNISGATATPKRTVWTFCHRDLQSKYIVVGSCDVVGDVLWLIYWYCYCYYVQWGIEDLKANKGDIRVSSQWILIMKRYLNEAIERKKERKKEWMNEWMNELMNESLSEWINRKNEWVVIWMKH